MMLSRRLPGFAWLALVLGVVSEVAVVLWFAAADGSRPEVATAFASLVAVVTALAGGLWPGLVAAVLGLAPLPAFAASRPLSAFLTGLSGLVVVGLAGVVSDRLRRSESERRLVAAELRVVCDAVSDAVIGITAEGTIASWSVGAARVYGYGSEEAVGRPLSMLFADDSPEQAGELIERARRGEGLEYRELIHRRADGGEVTVAFTVGPVRNEAGELVAGCAVAADVSERARLSEQLRQAEWRHQALVEQLPLITYLRAPDNRAALFSVSPQVEAVLGYSPDEWLAEPELFSRLLDPGDREQVLGTQNGAGEPRRREYRMHARDGRTVWLRDESATVRDGSGHALYTQGFLIDISDTKAHQAERERLRSAEEAAVAQGVEKQERLDFLAAMSETLGSSLDCEKTLGKVTELVARDLADWCVFDVLEEEGEFVPLAIAHSEPTSPQVARNREPDLRRKAVVSRVIEAGRSEISPATAALSRDLTPVGSPNGGPQCESYICAPLLVRRRALGALTLISTTPGRRFGADDLATVEELARRAAAAIDTARLYREVEERADAARVLTYVADGVFLLERTGVIRLWNPAAEAITGLSASSVVGRAVRDVLPTWENVVDRIPVSMSPEPVHTETVPLETPRGERWISISGVDFFGGTVFAFRDFTEERRLDELKAEFVATASHELRTPLAAVYGAAQTLRRHDFALDEAGRERFLSLIVEESERLSRIVNEILLANQLEAGRLDLATEPFDPTELVERVIESTRAHLPPGMSLEDVPATPVPLVAADRDKVRQVLINLVENAIKYSPEGGTVQVGLEPWESVVRFSVKDEGLGIPPEEHERIFAKFYRLDPDMTRGVGGTGLGLYICSELVTRMDGRIWVESEEGRGSTFLFELPAVESVPTPPAAPEALGAPAARRPL
jgi:PAS domain S-box-containing protein